MNLASLLVKAAHTYPERPAISLGTRTHCAYEALARRVAALATSFRERLKLAPGDRVALAMRNCPAFYETLFAAWHAGLAAVPVNAKLHRREIAYILDHSGARVCLASAELAQAVAAEADSLDDLERVVSVDDREYVALLDADPAGLSDVAPDDLAWLFYTSGTTGRPKGAMLSHRNLLMAILGYLGDIGAIAPGDSWIHAAPMSHASGLYGLPHLARGANQVVPESGGFEPAELFDLIAHYPGTSFFSAPTMVTRLIDHPASAVADAANLKTLVYGGGPMYLEDIVRALARLGPKLTQIYGQGESPMTITVLDRKAHADTEHPRHRQRLASVGVPFTCIEVRVADEDDNDVALGETGEVLVRGDTVMAGYWRDEEATAETLRGGWLHTGDVGALDGDGFLTLKDRSKDMIISGGTNIYPREIEEVLLRHEGVGECSVVGRPHPDWGEEVVAFVVLNPDAKVDEAELDELCLSHIARFKRPRGYRFVDGLPKNNYGKVLKTDLRQRLADEEADEE